MEHVYISLDLGGTHLRIALIKKDGSILSQKKLSSQKVQDPSNCISELTCLINNLIKEAKSGSLLTKGIALGIPGLVHSKRGIILESPHFPKWKNFHLKSLLEQKWAVPIHLENDANQAALGEACFGAGKELKDFILLTLGTGVGGGIIHDQKIFHGSEGFAGEIGHLVISQEGRPCPCGGYGCLETEISQSGLQANLKWKKENGELTKGLEILDLSSPFLPQKLYELALQDNKGALQVWKNVGKALGMGISSLSHCFGIFNFIIGGGLCGAWNFFMPSCEKEISKRMYASLSKKIFLSPAALGDQAGLLGGLALLTKKEGSIN